MLLWLKRLMLSFFVGEQSSFSCARRRLDRGHAQKVNFWFRNVANNLPLTRSWSDCHVIIWPSEPHCVENNSGVTNSGYIPTRWDGSEQTIGCSNHIRRFSYSYFLDLQWVRFDLNVVGPHRTDQSYVLIITLAWWFQHCGVSLCFCVSHSWCWTALVAE